MKPDNDSRITEQFHEAGAFEKLYIQMRIKEQRFCTDDELVKLPDVGRAHMYHAEWTIRKRSAKNLLVYLQKKNKPLNILEVGCGNGWLSSMLADISQSAVTGIDINSYDLEQAKRVFHKKKNLVFLNKDLRSEHFDGQQFDIIVFAASIQYFFSTEKIIERALRLLSRGGEIHIIDSFFYTPEEIPGAKLRSEKYFRKMGFPELKEFYFHHSTDSLQPFKHRYMANRFSLADIFSAGRRKFPWICITNK